MDGTVVIGTELDTKGFEKQIEDVSRRLDDVQQSLVMASEDKTLFSTQEVRELEIEAEKLTNKLDQLKKKQSQIDNQPNNFLKGLKSIGNETNKVINKVGRWALAIFGIRSAYMFVRQAMSTLSQYDDQMATNIEYIRYMLASALKPLIETLINLAYQLLTYLNYIAQTWFGINLFANATTEEFMRQKKEMKGTSKEAKELQKTLAGFDEMNIVQKNNTGGGGGITMPSFPKMEDVKIPKWMKWIADHKDEIIAGLTGIGTAIGLINMGVGILTASGIGLIVSGLAYSILSIIDYLNDPSFENFGKTIQGIGGAIVGLGIAIGSTFAGLTGGVVLLWGTIIKYWTQIKQFLEGIYTWFEERLEDIESVFGETVANNFKIFIESGRQAIQRFEEYIGNLKMIFDGFINFFKNVFTGKWEDAWESLKQIVSGVLGAMVTMAKGVLDNIGSLIKIWVNNITGAIKDIINMAIASIENMINTPISILNGFVDILKGFGVKAKYLGYVKLPRLAKGGIVNMPGRGVPIGSAITGERGQEGVIPLTDSQQMDLLGQSIGKHITINATIPVYAYNRQVDKQIRKIKAEDDFAYNR